MASATWVAEPPLSELNTTPLIDVLLMLLILFVITIPPATHSLDIALPSDRGGVPPLNPLNNTVTIADTGRLDWNGATVTEGQLATLPDASTTLRPEPQLKFEPSGQAPYPVAARTLRLIKASGVETFGFVGTERFAEFQRAR